MGIIKSKHIDYLNEKDFAEAVQEDLAEQSKFFKEREREIPQHVIDEEKVDRALERMRDQAQMDMFNDETMNWSGLR